MSNELKLKELLIENAYIIFKEEELNNNSWLNICKYEDGKLEDNLNMNRLIRRNYPYERNTEYPLYKYEEVEKILNTADYKDLKIIKFIKLGELTDLKSEVNIKDIKKCLNNRNLTEWILKNTESSKFLKEIVSKFNKIIEELYSEIKEDYKDNEISKKLRIIKEKKNSYIGINGIFKDIELNKKIEIRIRIEEEFYINIYIEEHVTKKEFYYGSIKLYLEKAEGTIIKKIRGKNQLQYIKEEIRKIITKFNIYNIASS